jgi:hypothetical protein
LGLLDSSPIPLPFVASCVSFQLRPLPSPGVTRLLRYLRASPPPQTARPGSHEPPVDHFRSPLGLPVLRLVPYVCMPPPLPRQDRWSCSLILPIDVGLPSIPGGSAPALPVSGPAQRSLPLRPTNSPSHQRDPLHQRLQQLRCLHYCSDCYRAERTSSRAGLSPAVDQRLFTAHRKFRQALPGHSCRSPKKVREISIVD